MILELLAFVSFLSASLLLLVIPEALSISVILLALASCIFVFLSYKRKNLHLLKHIIRLALVIGIFAISNYIVKKLSVDHDFTQQKIHSLSDKSNKVLEGLNKELKLTVFAKRERWKSYLNLLKLYRRSSHHIKINAIDPIYEPLKAKANGVERDNVLLIEYGHKKVILSKLSELEITNAILKLSSKKERYACYSIGHGEFSFSDTKSYGLSSLKGKIENESFELMELDLIKQPGVSLNCNLLLLMGVKEDFTKPELEKLQAYLDKGGSLLVTIGPNFTKKRTLFFEFLKTNGVDAKNSIVIDRLSSVHGVDATISVIDKFLSHEITKSFKSRVYFPMGISLEAKGTEKVLVNPLFESSPFPGSWGELSLEKVKKGEARFDEGDLKGPISLALAISNYQNMSRLVVFSSEQFVLNSYQGQAGNFNLFLNALAWLSGDEGIISLDRPLIRNQKLNLSVPEINLIFYISIILMPAIFFLLAFFFYRRKYKR